MNEDNRFEAITAALKAKETKYKTILKTAVDGFMMADPGGRILEVNEAYCRMSGYSEKELLSMRIPDLEGRMSSEEVAAEIDRVSKGGYIRFETRHRRKDGGVYDVEISARFMPIEGGRHVNFIRDISAIKTAEKQSAALQDQLIQAQKMDSIGRLAGGVAHDLNNLLAPILGYTEMLMEDFEKDADLLQKLRTIHTAGSGARNLVGQLLAFSRKQTLDFRLLDLDAVLLGFETLIRRTLREDILMNLVMPAGSKLVLADQTQLEQIIMNLSANAADAMPEGGVLTIENGLVQPDAAHLETHPDTIPETLALLRFSDTGHGMDKETCNKVFEPFYSTKGQQGTGLGLATVYGIVKQHGGSIRVESEVGKGSVFSIYLPLARETVENEMPAKAHVRHLTGSETILLAEDNDGVRNLVADILTRNGYTVFRSANGNQALETWASTDQPVDLLVTDVIMPGMSGRELFASLHSMDRLIRVLYMSGYPENTIARHGILDRNEHYIQKPFNTDAFLVKVRQILDHQPCR